MFKTCFMTNVQVTVSTILICKSLNVYWTNFSSYAMIDEYDHALWMQKDGFKVFNMFYPSPNISWDLLHTCD